MTSTQLYDFDTLHDRSNTSSIKWMNRVSNDGELIPMNPNAISLWVAEMEFPNPPEIREAMKRRIDHGFFGYTLSPDPLKDVIVERMKRLYNWDIHSDWILFNPGMVMFLSAVTQALTQAGDGVLMNTPVYGPFLSRPTHYQRFGQRVPMVRVDDDASTFHYEIDFDDFEASITPQTKMYYLCNPHNPVGKAFSIDELERLADICMKHNVLIVSDDIHCDLMLDGKQHTPIATLSPEVEKNSIIMIAGTKTFNMAGIACSVAIIPDEEKRKKVADFSKNAGYHADVLAYEALKAGYEHCGEWLRQATSYLTENRNLLTETIRAELPMLKTTVPDATYMSWLDCSQLNYKDKYVSATEFFAEEANVVLSPGTFFGDGLEDYVRLNFAVPRHILVQALQQMREAVETL
ncbi:MAG: PatB family C-S lyase [Chloroflexota bacterium]